MAGCNLSTTSIVCIVLQKVVTSCHNAYDISLMYCKIMCINIYAGDNQFAVITSSYVSLQSKCSHELGIYKLSLRCYHSI